MAILSAVQAGALRVGASLKSIGKGFNASVNSAIGTSGETIARTRKKIIDTAKRTETEEKKQQNLNKKEREELERRRREDIVENTRVAKKAPLTLKSVLIEKPMSILKLLFTAWVIRNGPKILKEIEIFTKKVRVFVAVIKRVPGAIVSVVGATVKFASVFLQNVLNFNFEDKRKKMEAAEKQFDKETEESFLTFSELVNVWNRDEDQLNAMLNSLDNDKSIAAAIESAGAGEYDWSTFPQNPIVGSQPEGAAGAGGGGSTRGGKVGALLDTISYAEGTPSYGTIYGGAVIPELAAGELSIAEVLNMQRTGKVRGRNAGYKKDGYDSDATGRYQFMSYVLKEEVEKQGISMSEKFTPALQDKLILGRIARMRGVTEEKIEQEGLSADIIDRLAPEFASFPNLVGPDNQGRTGTNTSFYGQGGKSKSQLDQSYAKNLQSNSDPIAAQVPRTAAGSSQLTSQVPFSDFSVVGGRGKVGKTSDFGSRGGAHMGVDIGTSNQKGWYCALKLNGKVTYNGWDAGGGWILYIKAGNKEYCFMHLARKSKLTVGSSYSSGTPIGEIGNTGRSRGEHLHFEVRVNNKHIDPNPYLNLIIIGKLPTRTQRVAQGNTNNSTRSDQIASISSKTTGGTQKQTNILKVTQKEIIMVG